MSNAVAPWGTPAHARLKRWWWQGPGGAHAGTTTSFPAALGAGGRTYRELVVKAHEKLDAVHGCQAVRGDFHVHQVRLPVVVGVGLRRLREAKGAGASGRRQTSPRVLGGARMAIMTMRRFVYTGSGDPRRSRWAERGERRIKSNHLNVHCHELVVVQLVQRLHARPYPLLSRHTRLHTLPPRLSESDGFDARRLGLSAGAQPPITAVAALERDCWRAPGAVRLKR
jgi:hypothetical protein